MTTVAAMFGALPLMLGHRRRLRASPSARPGDRRRPRLQPGADALHDAGHLSLLRAARRALRHRRRRSALAAEAAVNNRFSELFIRRPVATIAADDRHRLRRAARLFATAGLAAAAGRLPDHLGAGEHAGREPGHDGDLGRRAARAPSRPDRRRQRDDVAEHARLDPHHAAVRPRPRHRRRGARRAGGDRRRARRPADQPAPEPDLS